MQNIPLEKDIVFGPVISRRLGRSLGINLLPTAVKCCSFNCIYCFFGSMPETTSDAADSQLPALEAVTNAIDKSLSDIRSGLLGVDFITFAGNGEPTLHPAYPKVVAIFTNGSRLGNSDVLTATSRLDRAIVKIDIVDRERFRKVNRPRSNNVDIEDIAKNASRLPNLSIQTAVMKSEGKIFDDVSVEFYCRLLKLASPREVQLYNIIYPPAENGVATVTKEELEMVADKVRRLTGLTVVLYDEVEVTADET
jgi:wyosine [tRNA(Phe)-imidazoG37] synthetase (radical SAM superfamily)